MWASEPFFTANDALDLKHQVKEGFSM